ncbi:MAG TPA: glycosyltransferase family 1 protein, partial [Candidatus Latescibacteria bacterium]|nr:glycosyltransferase family 1 protein [Candidatus Latescibacterota bacterium]
MAPRIPELSVIPHGVDERFHRAAKRHASGFATTEAPFFLVVGNSKPNKNVARIVGAMALLVQKVPEVRLRIVGRGEGYRELRSQVDSLGLTQKVDFYGNVPDEELLDALQRAVALVFPSLVEGFGMPVLEAQAVGCPVITSDRGVLPETAGDAALFVDPYDAWDIARAMETLYRDLPLRESLVRKGRERATRFTWEETARKTRHVYDLVMGQSLPEFHAVRQVLAPAAGVQA